MWPHPFPIRPRGSHGEVVAACSHARQHSRNRKPCETPMLGPWPPDERSRAHFGSVRRAEGLVEGDAALADAVPRNDAPGAVARGASVNHT
jgi:hypothetical protein